MRYSLGRPAPGHEPTIGWVNLGYRWGARGAAFSRGTTLRCECGWNAGKVSNEPPSRGGRPAAQAAYRDHMKEG